MHTALLHNLLHCHEDNDDRVLNSATKQPRQGPSGRQCGRGHSVLIGFLPLILRSEASIHQVISVILDTSIDSRRRETSDIPQGFQVPEADSAFIRGSLVAHSMNILYSFLLVLR